MVDQSADPFRPRILVRTLGGSHGTNQNSEGKEVASCVN
jgi:hypothetical protein